MDRPRRHVGLGVINHVESEMHLDWHDTRYSIICPDMAVVAYVVGQFTCGPSSAQPLRHVRIEIGFANGSLPDGMIIDTRASFRNWTYRHMLLGDLHILKSGQGHEDAHELRTTNWVDWKIFAPREAAGVIACRLIRELVREEVLLNAGQMFHGSGVFLKEANAGLMFLGESGAGKTTLVAWLSSHGHAHSVATDRVMAALKDDGPRMIGIPTTTRLGEGALRSLLGGDVMARADLARHGSPGSVALDKWAFGNNEASRYLNMSFRSSAPLHGIVLLKATDADEPTSIRQLSPEAATGDIAPHCLQVDEDYPSLWMTQDEGAAAPRGPTPQDFAEAVPCFCMRWCPAAHSVQIRDLMADIAARASGRT